MEYIRSKGKEQHDYRESNTEKQILMQLKNLSTFNFTEASISFNFLYILYIFQKSDIFANFALANGSVAQLYRASDSGSEGHGLESHRGHLFIFQTADIHQSISVFLLPKQKKFHFQICFFHKYHILQCSFLFRLTVQ